MFGCWSPAKGSPETIDSPSRRPKRNTRPSCYPSRHPSTPSSLRIPSPGRVTLEMQFSGTALTWLGSGLRCRFLTAPLCKGCKAQRSSPGENRLPDPAYISSPVGPFCLWFWLTFVFWSLVEPFFFQTHITVLLPCISFCLSSRPCTLSRFLNSSISNLTAD